MSHFSVLVIGENVAAQLQPYHEFECTGTNDEYVQDIDETEEQRAEYERAAESKYRDPHTGELVCGYDDRFYRDPTPEEVKKNGSMLGSGWGGGISYTSKDWGDGRGYRAKVLDRPDWEVVEIRTQDIRSFAQYLEDEGRHSVPFGQEPDLENTHKYGYALLDANGDVTKVIDRTNPNNTWDWWVVGGHWSGWLKLKSGVTESALGSPSLIGSCWDRSNGRADIARKGDVDFAGMQADAAKEASERWNKARAATGPLPWDTWENVRAQFPGDIDGARKAYKEQRQIAALEAAFKDEWLRDHDKFLIPRDVFVARAAAKAIVPFALVKDSKWHAQGTMGFWAVIHDEKDEDAWIEEASRALMDLPTGTLLTVVDCHI